MVSEEVIKVKIPKELKIKKEIIDLEDLIKEYNKIKAKKEVEKIRHLLKGKKVPQNYKSLKYDRLIK